MCGMISPTQETGPEPKSSLLRANAFSLDCNSVVFRNTSNRSPTSLADTWVFNYYSYAAGDCLLTHDDTDQGYAMKGKHAPLRRIAVATYFHEEWHSDWGGELIIYKKRSGHTSEKPDLEVTHCIEPRPGSLVMFTVPRFHRVCRVDETAGEHRRLSIAGWFMTEHS